MESENTKSTLVTIILWNQNKEALFLGEVLEEALQVIETEYERVRVDEDGAQHFMLKQARAQELSPNWLFVGQGEGTA